MISEWFPLLTMIPVRENSEVSIIYPYIYISPRIFGTCGPGLRPAAKTCVPPFWVVGTCVWSGDHPNRHGYIQHQPQSTNYHFHIYIYTYVYIYICIIHIYIYAYLDIHSLSLFLVQVTVLRDTQLHCHRGFFHLAPSADAQLTCDQGLPTCLENQCTLG